MDDFEDVKPERVYAPPPPKRKPILVIDLTKDQLDLPSDLLELMAQHAADQVRESIQEVHWRIGPHIVAKTQVKERLPKKPSYQEEMAAKVRHRPGRPSANEAVLPGMFDHTGRYRVV